MWIEATKFHTVVMPQNINQPSHSSAELGPAQPPLVIIFYPFLKDRPTDQPMKGDLEAVSCDSTLRNL